MKKLFSILALFMALTMLVACGGNDVSNLGNGDSNQESKDETVEIGVSLEDLVKAFKHDASIVETKLYDENNVVIIVKKLSFTEDEVVLDISITNNNSSTVCFSAGSAACSGNAINGIMISDGFLNVDVEAGNTVDGTIEFDIDELVLRGISDISSLVIRFWVSGDDIDNFYTDQLVIETSNSNTCDYSKSYYQELVESGDFESVTNGEILYYSNEDIYSNADIDVVSVAIIRNSSGDVNAFVEIKNNSNEHVSAWGKEMHINGEPVKSSSAWVDLIYAGYSIIETFSLSNYAEKYEGDVDVKNMTEFKFTLSTGETSNLADNSGEVIITFDGKTIELLSE